MSSHNASQPWPGVSMRVEEVYPFHDGWNVACFVILLLFVLTVLSLATLALLYELLDCGCCAKDKTVRDVRQEPGTFRAVMNRMRNRHVEVV